MHLCNRLHAPITASNYWPIPKKTLHTLTQWRVGGQIGGIFTHWIVGKFVESDGAKGALGPAFFAMAARLTREVRGSQVANG